MTADIRFEAEVIRPFAVPHGGRTLTYEQYLALPPSARSNDEADAVDIRVTHKVLEWLGHGGAFNYNRTKHIGRPDFSVEAGGLPIFVVEDKNTAEDYSPTVVDQLAGYISGSARYGLWCNGREIRAWQNPGTKNETLVVAADFSLIWGPSPGLEPRVEQERANLRLLWLLFNRDRFTEFERLVADIAIDGPTWRAQARDLADDVERAQFIASSNAVLADIRTAAEAQVRQALLDVAAHDRAMDLLRVAWRTERDRLAAAIGTPATQSAVVASINAYEAGLGSLSDEALRIVSSSAGATFGNAAAAWLDRALAANLHARALVAAYTRARTIADAFATWSSRQLAEDDRNPGSFAEQLAYVFFVRLVLARVLEDKGVLPERIASDGGFSRWVDFVARHFMPGVGDVRAGSFTDLLFETVSSFYQHFFHHHVFDWFRPDDYLLVKLLRHLNEYDFSLISTDIIGFTYEAFVDRVARNRKGHFLTRPATVDYILDAAGYDGVQVIGRRMIDPACGSGSFLVHAAGRYRSAIASHLAAARHVPVSDVLSGAAADARRQLAEDHLQALSEFFYGLDINPFSCYLAELNLFVQALDDLQYLRMQGIVRTVERFNIFTTDSLSLPDDLLNLPFGAPVPTNVRDHNALMVEVDEAFAIKVLEEPRGFQYVIANPPYISGRRNPEALPNVDNPFYEIVLTHERNTYLLFLRLAAHYVFPGGRIAFVIPANLIGDWSGSAARELLSRHEFRLRHVTRFTSETVLFEGVAQSVCVVVGDRATDERDIIIAVGDDVVPASASARTVPYDDAVRNTPAAGRWGAAWLVSGRAQDYEAWARLRAAARGSIEDLWRGVLFDQQGDVNATTASPLFRTAAGPTYLPLYKGEETPPYGPLPQPTRWIDHGPTGLTGARENQRRAVEAIAANPDRQPGFILRQVQNQRVRRRISGTWFVREPGSTFAFDNTVWRVVCEPVSLDRGKAMFGVTTSALANWVFGLFSSNNHISLEEIRRTPTPDTATFPVAALAAAVDHVLTTRRLLAVNGIQRYDARVDIAVHSITPSALRVRDEVRLPLVTLQNAVVRGDLIVTSPPNRTAATALARGEITGAGGTQPPEFIEAVRLLLGQAAGSLGALLPTFHVPESGSAAAFMAAHATAQAECNTLFVNFFAAREALDDLVFDWYGTPAADRDLMRAGAPWQTGAEDF